MTNMTCLHDNNQHLANCGRHARTAT